MRAIFMLLLAGFLPAGATFAQTPPHLGAEGRADYAAYTAAPRHRAFAVAPGGAWGWIGDEAAAADAVEIALASCSAHTEQKCVLYSVDGKRVFDDRTWKRLWGPYADATTARLAAVGTQLGARFPDLAFAAADGRQLTLSQLRGKVVVLHFWGSWCGPCRREMPDLQKLFEAMKGRADVAFVLLQVREKAAVSRQWAAAQGLRLPFYDSGATAGKDGELRTADGAPIRDRELAMSFPTTYVLDKRGLVVFSHVGPVAEWPQYADFLADAAQRSGH